DMPYDNWAMAADAANGQLVVSGGVTQGLPRAPTGAPASDRPPNRGPGTSRPKNRGNGPGGGAGSYRAGGSTGGFTPSTGVEQHPDYTDCAVSTDVPWFSVDPATATLQPGQSLTVTVTMDPAVDQPGTYTGGVAIRHDTPYQVNPVDVT